MNEAMREIGILIPITSVAWNCHRNRNNTSSDSTARYGLRVGDYCPMSNHVHLVVTPETRENLANALGRTQSGNDLHNWLLSLICPVNVSNLL